MTWIAVCRFDEFSDKIWKMIRSTNCRVRITFDASYSISTVVLHNLNCTWLNVEDSGYDGPMSHLGHILFSMSKFFSLNPVKSCHRFWGSLVIFTFIRRFSYGCL